jgi:lambda family phage portal protein
MKNPVTILGANGLPLQRKTSALSGGSNTPYDAADNSGQHMADWQPYLWSADGEVNMYRDRIVSRVRDVVRNDGWASGAVTRILDNVIGANFRPISKPDYRSLAAVTGIKGFDATWASEFGKAVDAHWRAWANDTSRYCDTQRNMTVSQMMRLAFRHKIIDGDALAMVNWIPERVGAGRARYATAIQIVDPDRLSNPNLHFDQNTMRGGVVIDGHGAATGYYIRRAHQGDWFSAGESVHWDLIQRETDWGRPIIVHDFDHDRAGQHRGGAGIFAPVLQRLKMLIKYDGVELDAAIINSIFGAYIESPYDPAMVEEALGHNGSELNDYQQGRADFHDQRKIKLGESRMPILFPGEKINAVASERPNSNFADFEGAMLRNFASAVGLSAQQVSNNWADVNYSSARGAAQEAWKTLNVRRINFAHGFAAPIRGAFLEESFEVDNLPLPAGAPSFMEYRTAYGKCLWMGPGRGLVDTVKERAGSILGMDGGFTTLERESAESDGEDWEENLDQRQIEVKAFKDRGLPVPEWGNYQLLNAGQTIAEPEIE